MTENNGAGNFAGRVRSARTTLGLSQSELASAAGVSLGAVQKWEGGETETPRKPQLERLAAALLTSPSFLLYGVDGVEDTPITLPQLHHAVLRVAAVVDQARAVQKELADQASATELRLGRISERLRAIEARLGPSKRRRKAQ